MGCTQDAMPGTMSESQEERTMPLRDHFRKPLRVNFRWEGFHSAWANTIVRVLNTQLFPARYRAEQHVHFGSEVEVDIAAVKEEPFETASNSERRDAAAA